MKKILILLAVATLPAASGCCCHAVVPLLPLQLVRPPGTLLPPAPVYAAPVAAHLCPDLSCRRHVRLLALCACARRSARCRQWPASCRSSWRAPRHADGVAGPTNVLPIAYAAILLRSGCPQRAAERLSRIARRAQSCAMCARPCCGGPFMGNVCYGPMMDCGGCGGCGSCDGGCSSCGGGGGCSSCGGGGRRSGTRSREVRRPHTGCGVIE